MLYELDVIQHSFVLYEKHKKLIIALAVCAVHSVSGLEAPYNTAALPPAVWRPLDTLL